MRRIARGHSPSCSGESNRLTDTIQQRRPRVDAQWWSLPLMRSVIGTAPSMLGPPRRRSRTLSVVLLASPGTYAAITEAAAVVPVVLRNVRRVGLDGPDFGSSSGMGASVQNWSEKLIEAKRNLSTPTAVVAMANIRH